MREKLRKHDPLPVLLPEDNVRGVQQWRWDRMSAAERVEALTGQTLSACRDILDLPLELAVRSNNVMSGKVQVIRAILSAVTRAGIESTRLRQMQDEVLGQLIADFDREERESGGNGMLDPHGKLR